MEKVITYNGRGYKIVKNPYGGWDFRDGSALIVGYSIKEIKEYIKGKEHA